MKPKAEKITDKSSLEEVFEIREKVFVIEQKVDPSKERDEFEADSSHFLAKLNGKSVGAARWRFTKEGIKLERFAVLPEERGKGVGQALVEAVLQDIATYPEATEKIKYLHSQIGAMPLYSKFGFKEVGEMF